MRPLRYHEGQIEVQQEAGTRDLADRMAHWVGPAADFAARADLLLFSYEADDGALHFAAISGQPPLVEVSDASALRIAGASGASLPAGRLGGLAINLAEQRRVRLNGELRPAVAGAELHIDEAFTLCRKYMAPSLGIGESTHVGPGSSELLAFDDPWLRGVVERAETTFLASVAPDGGPDVAHRGGPPGFLELDPAAGTLSWPEYLGDGVFKSAGNVRATGRMTLLVLDLENGDAVEFIGRGSYSNLRKMRGERRDPLVQHRDAFPAQGRIDCALDRAVRLRALSSPRNRLERAVKVTSQSAIDEQAPR